MPPMLAGLLLGLLLVFPGLEFIKFLGGKVTGLYPGMTLTEACLAMVVILLSIIALRGSRLRNWAKTVADRTGPRKAKVALARKLAVTLHAMWRTNTPFQEEAAMA